MEKTTIVCDNCEQLLPQPPMGYYRLKFVDELLDLKDKHFCNLDCMKSFYDMRKKEENR